MLERSHSFTCHPHVYPQMKWTILLSLRKHSPDGATQARYSTSDYSSLLIYRPRKDERLSFPPTCRLFISKTTQLANAAPSSSCSLLWVFLKTLQANEYKTQISKRTIKPQPTKAFRALVIFNISAATVSGGICECTTPPLDYSRQVGNLWVGTSPSCSSYQPGMRLRSPFVM